MAYILGRAEFWSLEFAVGPGVLVPRADSETLIEAAVAAFPDPARPLRLLDIGVGSGCLLLTLLARFPHARGGRRPTSPPPHWLRAPATPRRCGSAIASRLDRTDLGRAASRGPFDLVVSNPPYIPSGRASRGWSRRSRASSRAAALDGGPDGLDAYRATPAGDSRAAGDGRAWL